MNKTLKVLAVIIATIGVATAIKRLNGSGIYVNEHGIVRFE